MEQFGETRKAAEKEYRGFVRSGVGEKTLWKELKGQSILGDIDFVDRLIGYVKKSKDIIEIPRSQRYVDRPSLRELFSDKRKRNIRISEAVYEYGYRQREVAGHLGIHYLTISRLLNKTE